MDRVSLRAKYVGADPARADRVGASPGKRHERHLGVSGGQRNARAVQSEPNKSGQSEPCTKRRDGPPHRTQMRAMGAGDAEASHAWTKSPPGTL